MYYFEFRFMFHFTDGQKLNAMRGERRHVSLLSFHEKLGRSEGMVWRSEKQPFMLIMF